MTTYNEAQCPNCGGFKTTTVTPTYTRPVKIPVQGKLKRDRIGCVMLWVFPVVSVLSGGILFFAPVILQVPLPESVWVVGSIIGGIIAGLIVSIWLVRKWTGGLVTKQITEELPGNDSACHLCGYRWHWDPSKPYPEVYLDATLIAKGEQRLQAEAEAQAGLEAEAEARRKRDLEWNHWNQWNNPNN